MVQIKNIVENVQQTVRLVFNKNAQAPLVIQDTIIKMDIAS